MKKLEIPVPIFNVYPRTTIVLTIIVIAFLICAVVEIILRMLAPISISNVGYIDTPNGMRFGWGFKPYGLVRTENPDTGEIIYDRVNKNGWRDRDRKYQNPSKAFRVLVLGDSETFGFIVPKQKTFTWLLEDRFRKEGMNVEIINISYSGWGTSQQLEALQKEGMKYKPNLIIINFNGNDISDNIIHTDPGKFGARIPFYHVLSKDRQLVRHNNTRFLAEKKRLTRKYLISKSELLKRMWLAKQAFKFSKRKTQIIDSGQLNLLQKALTKKNFEHLKSKFKDKVGREMSLSELKQSLKSFNLDPKMLKTIIRITENISFQRSFHGSQGILGKRILNKDRWQLYKKIMESIRDTAQKEGAEVALTTDYGPGLLKWMQYWRRAPRGEEAQKIFLLNKPPLKSLSDTIGIRFIETSTNDERAINDPHLNRNGHMSKANDLYNYLMANFEDKLKKR